MLCGGHHFACISNSIHALPHDEVQNVRVATVHYEELGDTLAKYPDVLHLNP